MFKFEKITATNATHWLNEYFDALSSPIEAFLEEHIFDSNLYLIQHESETIGLTAVHNQSLLTLFYMPDEHKRLGQQAFAEAMRLERVQEAFVPTCDEYFLAVALERARSVKPQAYFFRELSAENHPYQNAPSFTLRPATLEDSQLIEAESGDFFAPLAERIARDEIFVGSAENHPVSIGIIEHSRIKPTIASVGMFVLESERQKGYATETIKALVTHCHHLGKMAVAGCYYYNHNSKKTLERAGLMTRTRLLRVQL